MNRALLLCGPTASGKTALAHGVWTPGVHLINGDSRLVYRGFDVGTAKPTPQERASFPWELIDVVGPGDSFTAQMFIDGVVSSLADGRPGLVAGGTPFYLDALKHGLFEGTTTDEARARVAELERAGGLGALQEEVGARDPAYAAVVDMQNGRRLTRALEAIYSTGETMTALRAKRAPPPLETLPVVLVPSRKTVYNRIEARARAMLAGGFIEEVALLLMDGVSHDAPAFTGIGYREVVDHLEGRLGRSELEGRLIERTRQLAKRQMTWFKKFEPAVFLDLAEPGEAREEPDAWIDPLPAWSGEGEIPGGPCRVAAAGREQKILSHIMEVWYGSQDHRDGGRAGRTVLAPEPPG